jgi:hypothetical protein
MAKIELQHRTAENGMIIRITKQNGNTDQKNKMAYRTTKTKMAT